MKYKISAFLTFCLIFLAGMSCVNRKEIKFGNVKKLEIKNINNNIVNLEITLPVDNPNPYNLKIKEVDLKVTTGKTELGKITQMDEIVIEKKTIKDYPVNVTVELSPALISNIMSLYKIFSSKPELKLTGKIKVRSLFYQKTINIEDYQLVY